jgi:hypothetical protein
MGYGVSREKILGLGVPVRVRGKCSQIEACLRQTGLCHWWALAWTAREC